MPKPYLSAKGSEKLEQERNQLEAKAAELRKREEQLSLQQRDVIGSVMLGAVASGDLTEGELHDFLRPLIKRKKDFETLGMSPDDETDLKPPLQVKSAAEDGEPEESDETEDADELGPVSSNAPLSPSTSSGAS